MNAKTLKALRGSIKKWADIVKGIGTDEGWSNCPLCRLFWPACLNCPVSEKVSGMECSKTPYDKWLTHQKTNHERPKKVYCPTCKTLAKKELKFLKSLLPKRRK